MTQQKPWAILSVQERHGYGAIPDTYSAQQEYNRNLTFHIYYLSPLPDEGGVRGNLKPYKHGKIGLTDDAALPEWLCGFLYLPFF
jgi:hypothetical protein